MQPYLHEFGEDWYNQAPRRLTNLALTGTLKDEGSQVVVLNQVLAHPLNNGYQGLHDLVVKKVNGHPVANLARLKQLVECSGVEENQGMSEQSRWVKIELEGGRLIIMDRHRVEQEGANEDILSSYRVPAIASADLI